LPGWSLCLVQLPASPSSARVAAWRRLREAGATRLLNGAWVLPGTAAHSAFFEQLLQTIRDRGGTGFVFTVSGLERTDEMIVQFFRADRAREYDEFGERCDAFLTEIGKESGAGKFTFAELEESEQDLAKLTRWQRKIKSRDFFPDDRWPQSVELMDRCRSKLHEFATAVYEAEGVQRDAQE
jgi:ChrB-like protein